MRRFGLWAVFVFSAIVAVGVVVQVYLIAAYFFGADALDAHGFVGGGVVHGAEVLAFLGALAAWWRRWALVGLALALPVIGTIQIAFVDGDEWVGAFHGLLAMVVMFLGAWLAWLAWRELRPRTPGVGG